MLGISINRQTTNRDFAQKLGVKFPLLCDTDRRVSKLYGVLSVFRMAKRVTFVMDREGVVRFVIRGDGATDPGNALEAVRVIG